MTSPAPRWSGPRRIAHRGGGTLAPENTLAAIREGIARGYRAVEFDVMLTADDVPVLMHDATFGRTVAGAGSIAATRWADLAQRDAGSWLDQRFAGERVPSYETVVRFCRSNGIWMNVELKPAPGAEARTGRAIGALTAVLLAEEGGAADGVLFSSFSTAALEVARSVAPQIPRGILFDDMPVDLADAVDLANALDCISAHCAERTVDAAVVAHFHRAGIAVLAYTVNDVERARALDEAGVDAIFTDRIDLLPFM